MKNPRLHTGAIRWAFPLGEGVLLSSLRLSAPPRMWEGQATNRHNICIRLGLGAHSLLLEQEDRISLRHRSCTIRLPP